MKLKQFNRFSKIFRGLKPGIKTLKKLQGIYLIMEVIGSIDNASGMLEDLGKQRFHLIFTSTKLIIVIPIDVRKAVKENIVHASSIKATSSLTREQVVHTMESRGKEIEKDLDNYISQNKDDIRIVDYNDISTVRLLKGNPFKLPHLIIRTNDSEMYFYLHHNNYRGTGKLDKDVYNGYLSVLKETLGDRVKPK